MANGYVLYNPLAGDGNAEEDAKLLQMLLKNMVTKVTSLWGQTSLAS